ncbi:SRPBCC family protein [bacterium]|nr:SRPBCC family protein [bacterium]
MNPFILKREQFVPRPRDEVFAFFDRPENLAEITPKDLGFHILTPTPIEMQRGAVIDYTIRPFPGLRLHWRTLITAYDPPHRFVDEQIKGPYAFWHHTHTFEEVEGGTLIRDEVRYLLPFGTLGNRLGAGLVRNRVEHIFNHRTQVIRKQFGIK